MKFFAAALALSSALISPVYGVVESDPNTEVATCDGEWEKDRITELDFYKSTVATNTLHEDGGELRFANIGTYKDNALDLRITVTSGDYTDIAQVWIDKKKGPSKKGDPDEMNGKTTGDYFGNINLQTVKRKPNSGEGNFRFCIVKSQTNEPQEVERFSWTVYDTDQRKSKIREKLLIDVQDCSSYQLVKNTQIQVSCEDGSDIPCGEDVRTQFLSTKTGTGDDNPTDPNSLTKLQLKRSIQFNFENTDCWDITYNHFCQYEHQKNPSQKFCDNYTGGNFLFAGSSEKITDQGECITAPPTDAPTAMPVEITLVPTVAETKPLPTEESLCGAEIDVCIAIDNSGSICAVGTPRLCENCSPNQPCNNGDATNDGMCCGNYATLTSFASDYVNSLNGKGSVSVVKFGSVAKVVSRQGTGDAAIAVINSSYYTGGYTNTEQALSLCKDQLKDAENPVIILVTDGTPTACAQSDPNKYKTAYQPSCNKGNCADCPNGYPEEAAVSVADQAANEGITVIPVIVNSVSTDTAQLEGLARCPTDSADCDVEEYKGLSVTSMDDIGSLLQSLIEVTECPDVCAQDVQDCKCFEPVSRDPNDNCEFPSCPVPACTQETKDCGEGLGFVSPDPENCCVIPECPTYSPTTSPTTSPTSVVCAADVQDCKCFEPVSRDPLNNCEFFDCPVQRCTEETKDCGEGLGFVSPDPENCCAMPECPTYSPTTSPTSSSPTDGDEGTPPKPPAPEPEGECPEDVQLLLINGETDGLDSFPIANAVQIVSQDTSTVNVRLTNAWTLGSTTVDNIFYNYQVNAFDEKCFEQEDVDGGEYAEISIQCLQSNPFARLEICVADNGGALSTPNNGEVPKCCQPDLPEGTPVVCYKMIIWCNTVCVDAVERRGLRGISL